MLDILSIHWELKRKTVDEVEFANYCQLSFKVKRCCTIPNNMLTNLPVMLEARTGNLNPLDLKKKCLLPESNEVDDVNKASEMVCASSESDPLPFTDNCIV